MKKIFFLAFLTYNALGQTRSSEEIKFDLLHTTLHLQPIWENETLEGHAELLLKPYFYEQDKIVLNAKNFIIKEVSNGNETLPYKYDERLIYIDLKRTYSQNDTLRLLISYTAQPSKIQELQNEENKSEKGLYFVNTKIKLKGRSPQLWTQGETQSSSSWFPTLDFPNQNHTQDIYIKVDKKLTTLSNGLLVGSKDLGNGLKEDHWKQNLPHAVYLTMIAAGDFVKVVDENFNRFEVSYYLEPSFAKEAYGIFGRTPEMITYFESLLGVSFPWQKYAQIPVRSFVTGAMENTTATTHGSNLLKNGHQLVDGNDDEVIAHELFHHWFGNYVTCETWGQLPMNEAFANYSEYLWTNHKYGQDEGDYSNFYNLLSYLDEAAEKQVPLIRFKYGSSEEMFDAFSYQKGGRILHLLRAEVGDAAFFKALNEYLKENAFQTTEVEKLRLSFEKITGRDLKWFFDQWFLGLGHPKIKIKHKVDSQKLKLEVFQELDSVQNQYFRIPLSLSIFTDKQKKDTTLQLNSKENLFEIPFEGNLKTFIPDEAGYFLGEWSDDRTHDEYYLQYALSDRVVSRIKALQKIGSQEAEKATLQDKDTRNVVISALDDKFWRIRQLAVWQFNDYDGDEFLKIEKKLESLIQNDPNSNVRTDALLAVKNFENPYHLQLAQTALKDTSYSVQAAGLELLLAQNEGDSLVDYYQNVDDSQIFGVVANYFVENQVSGKIDWFLERLQLMEAVDLYSYMGLLGSYLVVSEEQDLNKALPFIVDIATNQNLWQARMAAVHVMFSLKDVSNAMEEAFEKAVAAEKDERLIKFYKELNVER